LEAVKAVKFKFKPIKKPYSAIRYNKNTVSLRGNLLSFSWSGKRIRQLISIPSYFKKYSGWKFQSATIGFNKQQNCFKANLTFTSSTPTTKQSDKVIGVDRGLYNVVSLSDGQQYNAWEIRKQKRKFLFVKRQLMAKGTRSAKRLLKKRSGREMRFSRNINHIISKWLVSLPYDVFVLEDLTGIRKHRKGKVLNGWLANWTFYQLEQFLVYKAEELGKQIVKVDARYTSQKCSNCGHTEKVNRDRSLFNCGKCGFKSNADLNAAINIRNNYLLEKQSKQNACELLSLIDKEQALVNEPYAATVMLAASHQPCVGGD